MYGTLSSDDLGLNPTQCVHCLNDPYAKQYHLMKSAYFLQYAILPILSNFR